MSAPHESWKVLPHSPLTPLGDGLLTVVGEVQMPLMKLPRRMTVVPLAGGRLLIWSAIALDETEMAKLEAAGIPSFLVVPNDHHRLDAKAWKQRYPEIVVVAPEGARKKVADTVAVDTGTPDFGDPGVQFVVVPGTRGEEAALVVKRSGGTTLVLNDIVANIRHPKGFGGWLLELMDFAGDEAQVPAPVRMSMVKDGDDLRAQLLRWADDASLRRIVVSHGEVIESDPQGTLRELAEKLK